jgi:hypothetical protein
MVRSLDVLPDGYFVSHAPGFGFTARDPGGVPLSDPLPDYASALVICVQHREAEVALGAMPRPRPVPPVTDGTEALVAGNAGVVGRVPFTTLTPSPRPGAVYSPQLGAGGITIAGDAEATGDAAAVVGE